MTVRLHPVQAAYRHSSALYRGFVGGRSAGKSTIGVYDLIRRAKPNRAYLIGDPTGVMLHDDTFPRFKKRAIEFGVWDPRAVKLSPYPTIRLTTGAEIRFRTAEDPEKFRGPDLSGVWLNEASLMTKAAFDVAIACLREGGEQGWLGATFTPKGIYHWTFDVFGKEGPNAALFKCPTWANPFNPVGFADTLKGQYTPAFARQELGGEFLEIEGAAWPADWFPESAWFDTWPAADEITLRAIAVDSSLGKNAKHGDFSAVVFLARDRDGTLWVEADMERRPPTKLVADGIAFAARARRETGGTLDGFGVESDVFQALIADDFVRQSKAAGIMLPVYQMTTGGIAKDLRIYRLTPYLSARTFRFRNTPGTQLLVRQMREFPIGDHDDGPDALEQVLRLAIELSHLGAA